MAELKTCLYMADRRALSNPAVFSRLLPLISAQRQETIARLRFDKDKQLSLAAGLLLRYALKEAGFNLNPEELQRDSYQKLFWPQHPELQFNLSHSEDYALCILSDCSAGCDIQFCGSAKPGIAKRFFHPAETEALEKIPDEKARQKEFIRLWALKESYMKCVGLGFSQALDTFAIQTEPSPPRLIHGKDPEAYRFYEWSREGYRLACCLKNYPGDTPPLLEIQLGIFGDFV